MSLTIQFTSLLVSFVYGLMMGFIYSVVNRLFYLFRKTILRLVIEMVMMAIFSFLYVMTNVYINDGQTNIYMLICLIAGLIVYEHYYAVYSLYYLEFLMKGLSFIFSPISFIFKRIYGMIKKVRKKVKQWQKIKKEKWTSQKSEE